MMFPLLSRERRWRDVIQRQKVSFTPGSLLQNRERIWSVKPRLCLNNTLNTKSYETSVQELIGSDPDLNPFFNAALVEKYKKLWLPTETDFQDLPSIFSSTSFPYSGQKSWWSAEEKVTRQPTSWVRTYCPLFTFSPVDTTDAENILVPLSVKKRQHTQEPLEERPCKRKCIISIKTPIAPPPPLQKKNKRVQKAVKLATEGKLLRSRKIRLQPNQEQSHQLRKAFGCARFVYNQCVELDRKKEIQGTSDKEKSRVRTLLTKEENAKAAGNEFLNEIPVMVKQQAVDEFFSAKKANLTKMVNGTIKHFKMGFRSAKKSRQECISFEKYKLVDGGKQKRGRKQRRKHVSHIWLRLGRKDVKIPVRGKLPSIFVGRKDETYLREAVKVVKCKLGYYYAIVTCVVDQKETNSTEVVALDPGARTFQTWYSNEVRCGKVGMGFQKLEGILHEADNLQRLETSASHAKQRRSIHRRYLRKLDKVRNMRKELHTWTKVWLCENHRLILLPKFESKQMVSRGILRSKTCRAMMTWAHYSFQRDLIAHAQLYTNVKVRICNEAYTSKTCGRCGFIKNNLGGAEVFKCSNCNLRADRDYHAARNILLRNLPFLVN